MTKGGGGGVYMFFVDGGRTVKVGRSKHPETRRRQWARQCRGEKQQWMLFYWAVDSPTDLEREIHRELKRRGAWRGRVLCHRCGKRHQEKFDVAKCGGSLGLVFPKIERLQNGHSRNRYGTRIHRKYGKCLASPGYAQIGRTRLPKMRQWLSSLQKIEYRRVKYHILTTIEQAR
ncbi:hypothetical protein B0H12DRAFT_1073025 [Mycena haematopus]|nr:hypothetical protein B0H12DRAFT_1073025 [Mycena haematopus]